MLPPCLFVVHNPGGCGQDDKAELTRRQKLDNPLLKVIEFDIVAGGDATSLVDTAIELDYDLSSAVIVNFFKFPNVPCVGKKKINPN